MKLSESDLSFAWQCQSCGCYFPHIPKVLDDDVKRCSKCVEVEILEARLSDVEDALEHCGYDPTDCIDCGGPPHNKWCRFWKLRDVVPLLFSLAEEA